MDFGRDIALGIRNQRAAVELQVEAIASRHTACDRSCRNEAVMVLKDIMSTTVESIGSRATLARAHQRMQQHAIHHLVVMNRGQVVGILTTGELETRMADGVTRVEDAVLRRVAIGVPEMTVEHAARLMRGRPDSALPVFEGKRLVGIVTISDLLDVLSRRVARPKRKGRSA